MKNYKLFSAICGVVASLSLLFLPVLGGGWERATGLRLMGLDANYVSQTCKLYLILAIACGIVIALARNALVSLVLGISGVITILVMNQMFYQGHGEMFSGAYIALLSFVGATICGFLGRTLEPKKSNS